jgi:hypothetical protein
MKVNQHFGGTYHLHETGSSSLHAGFLLGILFDPEGGSRMFLQNFGLLSPDYTALYPRRQNSSNYHYHPFQYYTTKQIPSIISEVFSKFILVVDIKSFLESHLSTSWQCAIYNFFVL